MCYCSLLLSFYIGCAWSSCADPEEGRRSGPSSLENHKAIGFLSNTGLDSQENHKANYRSSIQCCWAIIGQPAKRHLIFRHHLTEKERAGCFASWCFCCRVTVFCVSYSVLCVPLCYVSVAFARHSYFLILDTGFSLLLKLMLMA